MFRIVLDTNVLLVSISSKSRLHWIFRKLVAGEFFLCVTTEILSEYAEIIERHIGEEACIATMGVLENLPNIVLINTYFKFQLLNDEDDNKFADCAVAANADFIVSHDKDFKILNSVSFPKIQVVDTVTFATLLMTP